MVKRLLIDAAHPEERRVVLLENGRIQEFDSETTIKKQIKGNIYLAKVTRVEPSLQAAFIDYGGERHGFLPFSEIHPDYYQIPASDKEKLLNAVKSSDEDWEEEEENEEEEAIDTFEKEDDFKKVRNFKDLSRKYNIQEVIKRGQILLVQADKEERGNKGASMTTYISLAGRYCVLMPNSPGKGGVSRRIGGVDVRRKLRSIIKGLGLNDNASIIVRTAGAKRNQDDITRDYNYLSSLWNKIRELTLSSSAPSYIHGESDLIRRSLRDIYDDSIEEIIVEGKEAYEDVKSFIKLIMPNQSSKLKPHRAKSSLFSKYNIEEQISALFDHTAHMPSGGYLVINPTEALISIDVNSGKLTSQKNIEDTAVATNLEAAYEVARQLRLRDLSGLIVIDFIDMLDHKNRKAVEKALKDALHNDRAKIQVGRISLFGLMEMSRQRLRPNFFELNAVACTHCNGIGYIKSKEAMAINVLRGLNKEISRIRPKGAIDVFAATEVAVYILNLKRDDLTLLEKHYGITIYIHPDSNAVNDNFAVEERKDFIKKKESIIAVEPVGYGVKSNDKKLIKKPKGLEGILVGIWKKIID